MYGSLANQIYHLSHFALSFAVVYLLIPRYLFNQVHGTATDRTLSYFLRMNLLVILLGYVLVISKLYEITGIAVCVAVLILLRKSRRINPAEDPATVMMARFYDLVELRYVLRMIVRQLRSWLLRIKDRPREQQRQWRPSLDWIQRLMVLAILIGSWYMRYRDAMTNPVPATSDGYVALAWMKYVDQRFLFHDGIYPQGMYFFMTLVGKLAFINALYINRYAGPLFTTLIVWGLYYVVKTLATSRPAGMVAASLYGIWGEWLLRGDWPRQAASNSQEYALLFVVPTAYFLYRYLMNGQRTDYWSAFSGLCVTGLSHPLVYLFNIIASISVLIAFTIFFLRDQGDRLLRALYGGILSAAVTLAPIGAGLLLGHSLNSASASFAVSTVQTTHAVFPVLHWTDWITLTAVVLLLIGVTVEVVRGNKRTEWLLGAVFGIIMFLVYFAGGPVTHSGVLAARATDLWAIAEPMVISMAFAVVFALMPGRTAFHWLETTTVAVFVTAASVLSPPTPIVAYKMQRAEDVQQYLYIDNTYKYTGYMIVAPREEYALVLGSGYHMSIPNFIRMFDPTKPPLTRRGDNTPFRGIAEDVFVYYAQHVYRLPESNSVYSIEAPIYRQRATDNAALYKWLMTYKQHHRTLDVFHSDPNLVIYHFHVLPPRK